MRLKKTFAALAGFVVVASLAVGLSAAPSDNPVNILNDLVASVNNLATTLNNFIAASAPGNTRITPPVVGFAPDTIFCTATNISDSSKSVRVQVIDANNGAILFDTGGAGLVLVPNGSTGGSTPGGASGTRAICKFTVVDGTKDDIRAVLALFSAATASDKLLAAAE